MQEPQEKDFSKDIYPLITTEHFTLSSARSVINGEISSRISIYFTTLSSVLIALAFFAQSDSMKPLFVIFGWIAVPLVVLLGLFSMARLMILSAMDMTYVRAINRIRNFYLKTAPSIETFLLFPPYDDDQSVSAYGGYSLSFRDALLSAANAVATANSLVATLGIGAISNTYLEVSIEQFLPYGLVAFVLAFVLHGILGFLLGSSNRRAEYFESRFPISEMSSQKGENSTSNPT